ncbi:RNA polymerase sigma-70 factor [Labilibaculum euxinus]
MTKDRNLINDPYFILQLKKGDHSSYETLFYLYFDKLYYFAFSYIEDSEDAREIIQNVFYKFWEKRTSLTVEMNLNAYLFRMTQNQCLDYIKHLKVKLGFKTFQENARADLGESSLSDDPSQQLIEAELFRKVNEVIEKLPKACKEIFIKSRFEGLKYKEIAEELSISPKTVENQISKALCFLRQELQYHLT